MSHLFATTDLERTYRVNLNVIGVDGRPAVKSLVTILKEWLAFRKATVKRRLEYRLERVERRIHILEGYLVAFLNIDEVIRIIREEDEPKPVLMKTFKISDIQAEAILDLKLRNLAKLEEMKIRGEQDELSEERDALKKTLGSDARLKTLIKRELKAVVDTHGDARRAPLAEREEAKAFSELELTTADPLTIVLSDKGWIRAAKGHEIDPESLSYKSGDGFRFAARGKSNLPTVVLDSTGRAYTLPTHQLPSARGQGEPLTGRINPPSGATFQGLLTGAEDDRFLLASDAGYGFVVQFGQLQAKNKAGKAVLTLPKNARVLSPAAIAAGGRTASLSWRPTRGVCWSFRWPTCPNWHGARVTSSLVFPQPEPPPEKSLLSAFVWPPRAIRCRSRPAGTTAISSGRSSNIFVENAGVVAASCQRATRG